MTLNEFKRLNETNNGKWFSEGAMQFFKTKIMTWDHTGWFITSEVNPTGQKGYTIRFADFETGKVSTIGDFMAYASRTKAQQALNELKSTRS